MLRTSLLETKRTWRRLALAFGPAMIFVLLLLFGLQAANPAHGATTFTVDRSDDPDLSTTPTAGGCTSADNDCSLRGAIRWLNEKRYERDEGMLLASASGLTVAVYLRRWLSGSVEGTVSLHTFRDYRDKVEKHIIPVLGKKKLKELTHQDLQALYRRKTREGLSARTDRYIHTTMSKALHEAEAGDLVRKNVARFAKPPKPDAEEREPMTADAIRDFLVAVKGHKDEALYLLAITSGMRRGELFGLKWSDLDLEGRR